MDRIREPRRGSGSSTLAVNGSRSGGPQHQPSPPLLPRRRPRTGGMRDSPEDDGATDIADPTTTTSSSGPMSRLRDRGMLRKDREREQRIDISARSSSKRRRGDRLLHHGGGRDDVDYTSDDSISDEDDDDDDEEEEEEEEEPTTATRYQQLPLTSSLSVAQNNSSGHYHQQLYQNNSYHHNSNNNHRQQSPPAQQQQKKGLLAKSPPVTWKAADEMIGVPVPRKARSASTKRSSHEWLVAGGGGGGGGGEPVLMQRQATSSASPWRPVSPASAASPSSSTASPAIRKKLKPINTGMKRPQPPAQQQQQPKISKSPSFIQEEIEVAEVLFGLTRQFQDPQPQPQPQPEPESKDAATNDSKPRDSSLPTAVAPKRKRPRIVKYDETKDSCPASPAKMDSSEMKTRLDASLLMPEMQADPAPPLDPAPEPENSMKEKQQELANLTPKEAAPDNPEANHGDTKFELASDGVREGRYCIDLMAPPDRDGAFDLDVDKGLDSEMEMVPKSDSVKEEVTDESASERLTLQLDLEKPGSADEEQAEQQQQAPKLEIKQEKAAPSLWMQATVEGWQLGFPPFSYSGQDPPFSTPSVHPMDVKPRLSNSFPPAAVLPQPPRPKRCATHCYIAQQIQYNQHVAKMNPFAIAAAAPGAALLLGPRPPFNMGIVPSADAASLLGSAMQGSHLEKNPASSLHDNKGPSMAAASFSGNLVKEKAALSNHLAVTESNQRKATIHEETPQSVPLPKMLGPAFIFPMNQQQAVAANQTGEAKPMPGAADAILPSGASISSEASSGTMAMNLNFTGMPTAEAQFIAMMQTPYQFPVAAQVGGAQEYRNAMPFWNGPVFSPQMLQPSPQRGPPQQLPQKSGMSSAASSQKHQQQQMQSIFGYGVNAAASTAAAAAVAMNPHSFLSSNQRPTLPPNLARPQDGDKVSQEGPSTTDNRAVLSQKGMYEHNYAGPVQVHNFALMQAAGAARSQSDKKSADQQQAAPGQGMRLDLTSSQPFAMPFASFPAGAAPTGRDFSSPAQNHALFQSHQEASRHGYMQLSNAQGGQHKLAQHQITIDMQTAAWDSTTTSGESERKKLAAAKLPAAESSHTLSFSKTDNKPFISSILSSGMNEGSSRTLSFIPDSANGLGMSSKTTGAATPTPGIAAQQQQQFIQLQKQQQQIQLQHQLLNARPKSASPSNNSSGYSERPTMPSNIAHFPQVMMSFPPAVVQTSSVPGQSKASSTEKPAAPVAAPSSSNLIVMKNSNVHPQQGKTPLQALSVPSHQNQISFSMNSSKPAPPVANLSGGAADVSRSSTATMASGSPSNSVCKSTGGSPPASGNAKSGHAAVALPPLQQTSSKNSSSSSNSKSLSMNHHSIPSILGQPNISPAPNSGNKTQPPPQQQPQLQSPVLKQTQYPQLYYNACTQRMQSHPAASAGYYQICPADKGQPLPHHQSSIPVSAGMLSLCPSWMSMSMAAAPSDPAKVTPAAAGPGGNMKVLPLPPGFLQATHLMAAAHPGNGASHSHMPTSFSFAPMVAATMSRKPTANQKPAAA